MFFRNRTRYEVRKVEKMLERHGVSLADLARDSVNPLPLATDGDSGVEVWFEDVKIGPRFGWFGAPTFSGHCYRQSRTSQVLNRGSANEVTEYPREEGQKFSYILPRYQRRAA